MHNQQLASCSALDCTGPGCSYPSWGGEPELPCKLHNIVHDRFLAYASKLAQLGCAANHTNLGLHLLLLPVTLKVLHGQEGVHPIAGHGHKLEVPTCMPALPVTGLTLIRLQQPAVEASNHVPSLELSPQDILDYIMDSSRCIQTTAAACCPAPARKPRLWAARTKVACIQA